MLPFVSVCTPTFNRRPFFYSAIECFNHQDYPKDRMEWVIIDDGTDKIGDLVRCLPNVKYIELDEKVSLGKKRNIMHSYCKGDIFVYLDDDDYYPPERVSHAVSKLQTSQALIAGSSEMYCYFNHNQEMWRFGPYSANHATAGTFAMKRELLNITSYKETDALSEEKEFLKNYSIPMVQLDSHKTILCFSHIQNTFDKRNLIAKGTSETCHKSGLNITKFIKQPHLIRWFTKDISPALEKYKLGDVSNKEDVIHALSCRDKELKKKNMDLLRKVDTILVNVNGKETPMRKDQINNILRENHNTWRLNSIIKKSLYNNTNRLFEMKQKLFAQGVESFPSHTVAYLVLATSKNRDLWKSMKDTYLLNKTLASSVQSNDPEHTYVYYIGIDKGDRIFDDSMEQSIVHDFVKQYSNVRVEFVVTDSCEKGHVTKMWNMLFQKAYDDGADYFFQCEDDIEFKTKGWISDSIDALEERSGFGMAGPLNNHSKLLTQAFVSRKHMLLFGWFFPESIRNWCCNDWYNHLYAPQYMVPFMHHFCENQGGEPRYIINENVDFKKSKELYTNNLKVLRTEVTTLANSHKASFNRCLDTHKQFKSVRNALCHRHKDSLKIALVCMLDDEQFTKNGVEWLKHLLCVFHEVPIVVLCGGNANTTNWVKLHDMEECVHVCEDPLCVDDVVEDAKQHNVVFTHVCHIESDWVFTRCFTLEDIQEMVSNDGKLIIPCFSDCSTALNVQCSENDICEFLDLLQNQITDDPDHTSCLVVPCAKLRQRVLQNQMATLMNHLSFK